MALEVREPLPGIRHTGVPAAPVEKDGLLSRFVIGPAVDHPDDCGCPFCRRRQGLRDKLEHEVLVPRATLEDIGRSLRRLSEAVVELNSRLDRPWYMFWRR